MKALKAFAYSHDGFTLKHLEAGDDASDVPADAVEGLKTEGYIGDGKGKAVETKVDEAPQETGAAESVDRYPHLSPAQEAALDVDGDGTPGGRKKKGA